MQTLKATEQRTAHITWNRYETRLLVRRLTAGIPANPKLMQAWLEVNDAPKGAAQDQAAMVERLDPNETHTVVFYRDEQGRPAYESRNMKAALKESANILKGIADVKNWRSRLAERVFVGPPTVPLNAEVHVAERPISVMTMQGPRTSIKRFEYAEDVELTFQIKVLCEKTNVVNQEQLEMLLEYLQDGGIGADRSQGSGTFEIMDFRLL